MPSSDSCLFVGDLSVICLESHLTDLFQDYGRVVRTEINRGSKPYKFLLYGFITMSTPEEAKEAMNTLNGVQLLGRKLRINWANVSEKYVEPPCAEVAFTFVSKQLKHLAYEQTFYDLFSTYGCEVVDVAIKTYKIEEVNSKQHGTGFVHYPLTPQGVLAAKRAVDHLANVVIKDILYDCGLSKNLQDILANRPDLDVPFHSERDIITGGGGDGSINQGGKKKQFALRILDPMNLPYVTVEEFRHVITHGEALLAAEQQKSKMASNNITVQSSYDQMMHMQQMRPRQQFHQHPLTPHDGAFPPYSAHHGQYSPGVNRTQLSASFGQYGDQFCPPQERSQFAPPPPAPQQVQAQLRFGGRQHKQMHQVQQLQQQYPLPMPVRVGPISSAEGSMSGGRHPNRHYRSPASAGAHHQNMAREQYHHLQQQYESQEERYHTEHEHHSPGQQRHHHHQQQQQRQLSSQLHAAGSYAQHQPTSPARAATRSMYYGADVKEEQRLILLQQLAELEYEGSGLDGEYQGPAAAAVGMSRSGGRYYEQQQKQRQQQQQRGGGGLFGDEGPDIGQFDGYQQTGASPQLFSSATRIRRGSVEGLGSEVDVAVGAFPSKAQVSPSNKTTARHQQQHATPPSMPHGRSVYSRPAHSELFGDDNGDYHCASVCGPIASSQPAHGLALVTDGVLGSGGDPSSSPIRGLLGSSSGGASTSRDHGIFDFNSEAFAAPQHPVFQQDFSSERDDRASAVLFGLDHDLSSLQLGATDAHADTAAQDVNSPTTGSEDHSEHSEHRL